VIGRAARFKSHANLPPQEQNVTVYWLILTKPKDRWRDRLPSADEMLVKMSDEKSAIIKQFYQYLYNNRIE
jgi:hypothetical protein